MFAEEDDLRCVASDIVRVKCEKSSLFNEKAEAQVPRFHPYGKKSWMSPPSLVVASRFCSCCSCY
jgi:hypothetical protein